MASWRNGSDVKKISSRKKIYFIMFAAIFCLLLLAYIYVTFIHVNPQRALLKSLDQITADLTGSNPVKLEGNFSIKNTKTNVENLKLSFNGNSNKGLLVANADRQLNFQAEYNQKGNSIGSSGEIYTSADKSLYFKMNKLNYLVGSLANNDQLPYVKDGVQLFDGVINKYDGKWVNIDEQTAKELGLMQKSPISGCYLKSPLSSSEQKVLIKQFKNNSFVKIQKFENKSELYFDLDVNKQLLEQILGSNNPISGECEIISYLKNVNKLELFVNKITYKPSKIIITNIEGDLESKIEIKPIKVGDKIIINKPNSKYNLKNVKDDIEQIIKVPLRSLL